MKDIFHKLSHTFIFTIDDKRNINGTDEMNELIVHKIMKFWRKILVINVKYYNMYGNKYDSGEIYESGLIIKDFLINYFSVKQRCRRTLGAFNIGFISFPFGKLWFKIFGNFSQYQNQTTWQAHKMNFDSNPEKLAN